MESGAKELILFHHDPDHTDECIDTVVTQARAGLYREASRYAEKFCRRLEQTLSRAQGRQAHGGGESEVLAELRRFYRLSNARKRAHIEHCE